MDMSNSNQQIDDLFHGNTFLPDTEPERFERLLAQVERNRYTMFVALYTELFQLFSAHEQVAGFFEQALAIVLMPAAEQRLIINHPVFQIWSILTFCETNLVLTGKNSDTLPLQGKLLEFCDVLKRIDVARDESPPVYRFDADPLIAQVTPPSYEFPQDEHLRKQLERGGYSTAFFRDVMQIALLRIQHTWPECHRQWQVLVKAVCYLPDGAFRSCSASRYTGVILLSSRDNSILDMEESLVHEAIHQLLYNIVEVCPVVDPQASRETLFTLPWSGQQRDLYGYFHAFYVYVALVKYLERVKSRPPRELRAARERLGFILRGLVRALPDFAASPDFTPQGRELLENLMREVQDLALRHAALLGDGEPAAEPVLGMTA